VPASLPDVPRGRHYAWRILGLCFLAILCAQGVRLSFGAFARPWEEAFDAGRGTITLIGSLSFLVYGGSQPFVGRAVDRSGIRRTLVPARCSSRSGSRSARWPRARGSSR
jgi:sugar phosphate permease